MKKYLIKKAAEPVTDESWQAAETAVIDSAPWDGFTPCPYRTEVKLLYTGEAIYVNFKTDERPLLATRTERNSDVCNDSCMEFFIKPGKNFEEYMNFEVNPIGTMLLSKRFDRYRTHHVDVDDSIFEIRSVITKKYWNLYYKIPFSFLKSEYGSFDDVMYGNFYKCSGNPDIEHYASWNLVETPKPDFHRPEFFGELIFEK